MYAPAPFSAAFVVSLLFNTLPTLAYPPPTHPHYNGPNDGAVVRTKGGTTIQGIIDPANPSVRQFLGIPLRCSTSWDSPLGATATGLARNYTSSSPSIYTRDVLEFIVPGGNNSPMGEDCLTISVWTPVSAGWDRVGGHGWQEGQGGPDCGPDGHTGNEGLPVMMFFYGGGWQTGGEDVPYQIPTQWVQRTQNLVVMSFNYRVNIFGFPDAAGVDDQNVGLLDQRLAVEWVRDNIASFGGDPTRITIWGQSAGAGSVDFYNFAWYDDPIVEGLIMDSGTALIPIRSSDASHSNFSFVAAQLGCSNEANAAAELACMRGLPATTIEQFVGTYQDSGSTPAISFSPIVDGKVVFNNYTERALEGKLANVSAIIGTNAQDGVPFAPYNQSAGPNQTIAQQALLSVFFCPAVVTTRNRLAAGRTTYRYEYDGNFSNISPLPWMGAYHSAELPLLFGTHPNHRGNSTPFEYAVSAAMQDAWQAFDADPAGGLAAQNWPPYTGPGGAVRIFAANGTVAQTGDLSALEMMCASVPVIAS